MTHVYTPHEAWGGIGLHWQLEGCYCLIPRRVAPAARASRAEGGGIDHIVRPACAMINARWAQVVHRVAASGRVKQIWCWK